MKHYLTGNYKDLLFLGRDVYRLKIVDRDESYGCSRSGSAFASSLYLKLVSEKLTPGLTNSCKVTGVEINDLDRGHVYCSRDKRSQEVNLRNVPLGIHLMSMRFIRRHNTNLEDHYKSLNTQCLCQVFIPVGDAFI